MRPSSCTLVALRCSAQVQCLLQTIPPKTRLETHRLVLGIDTKDAAMPGLIADEAQPEGQQQAFATTFLFPMSESAEFCVATSERHVGKRYTLLHFDPK